MTETIVRPSPAISDEFHPVFYKALIGLALWFVLSAWGFFAHGGYIGLTLAVVSGLVLVTVVIPATLWRIWRAHSDATDEGGESFSLWLLREIEIRRGRLTAAHAMIEALTPIAAVAFGTTAFAIVFRCIA